MANVMSKFPLKKIRVASDGLGAVPARMFCVEMGKRKRGVFAKTKNIFGT